MPHFQRYIGIDYSGAETPDSSRKGLRLPLGKSPRAPCSGRRKPGRTVRWFKVVRTPRGGFGLGCRWRYGDAPAPVRSFRRLSHRPAGTTGLEPATSAVTASVLT
jgi:hypothetical protein